MVVTLSTFQLFFGIFSSFTNVYDCFFLHGRAGGSVGVESKRSFELLLGLLISFARMKIKCITDVFTCFLFFIFWVGEGEEGCLGVDVECSLQ